MNIRMHQQKIASSLWSLLEDFRDRNLTDMHALINVLQGRFPEYKIFVNHPTLNQSKIGTVEVWGNGLNYNDRVVVKSSRTFNGYRSVCEFVESCRKLVFHVYK